MKAKRTSVKHITSMVHQSKHTKKVLLPFLVLMVGVLGFLGYSVSHAAFQEPTALPPGGQPLNETSVIGSLKNVLDVNANASAFEGDTILGGQLFLSNLCFGTTANADCKSTWEDVMSGALQNLQQITNTGTTTTHGITVDSDGDETTTIGGILNVGSTFGFGLNNQRTELRANAGLQGNAGAQSGFFETSAPSPTSSWPAGASGWWHLLDVRHGNTSDNYALQLAGSFFDQNLYFRKTNNNPSTSWSKVATQAQIDSLNSRLTDVEGGIINWEDSPSGGGASANSVIYTTGFYPAYYTDDIDDPCTTEYGAYRHIASAGDVALYASIGIASGASNEENQFWAREDMSNTNAGSESPHGITVSSNDKGVYVYDASATSRTTTLKMICVKDTAPILYTTGMYPAKYTGDINTPCVDEYGDNFHLASAGDVALYASVGLASGDSRDENKFWTREDMSSTSSASEPAHGIQINSNGAVSVYDTDSRARTTAMKMVCVRE